MYTVYILFSEALKKYYVGSTQHFIIRFEEHNRGKSNFTSTGIPWILVKKIEVNSRAEALRLETKIKKRGIERYLKNSNHL
ncbi:MAG: GIY-YIG nuclease family protein [Saprospiraceae bacterium]|nr:GIY-YIG nuclease family protein [Saprospiraceae bacterium]MBK9729497.1 GIY-YIG nuclease family protein [Saprospiraceae bacterium]